MNVFAPAAANADANLPVVVYIYGGAFMAGASSMYDPSALVANGNVLAVTFNYRIGYLGLLAHPALSKNDPQGISGNYGLLDQKAALQWVQKNIQNFGGDPKNVTVFGESAGAQSIYAQMIMTNPAPFKAAIIASGSFQTQYPTLAQAEKVGEQAALKLGCADQSLKCLKGLSAGKLAYALNPLKLPEDTDQLPVSPVVDGVHIKRGPAQAFESGEFLRVPVIHGSNHDEWRLFIGLGRFFGTKALTASGYEDNVRKVYGSDAQEVLARYPLANYAQPDYAWAAVLTDSAWACTTHMLNAQMSRYVPVYAYEMNDPSGPEPFAPNLWNWNYGSAHGSELTYMFPDLHAPILRFFPPSLTPSQAAMGKTLQNLWLTFAKSGTPSAAGAPVWPTFNSTRQNVLSMAPAGIAVDSAGFVSDHHCDFWAARTLERAGLPDDAAY